MPANSVTLIGNLVDDPELRFTASGVAMAKVRFAVNRRWQDRNGEWQEDTSFFGGTLWNLPRTSERVSVISSRRRRKLTLSRIRPTASVHLSPP